MLRDLFDNSLSVTYIQTDIQTNRHTDRQTYRQTDIQTDIQTEPPTKRDLEELSLIKKNWKRIDNSIIRVAT